MSIIGQDVNYGQEEKNEVDKLRHDFAKLVNNLPNRWRWFFVIMAMLIDYGAIAYSLGLKEKNLLNPDELDQEEGLFIGLCIHELPGLALAE